MLNKSKLLGNIATQETEHHETDKPPFSNLMGPRWQVFDKR
jgi:hypothetical protein